MTSSEQLTDSGKRLQVIPIVYVRGTHYECGFSVGHTFASSIQEFIASSSLLNKHFLPVYNTQEGKKVYDQTLKVVNERFPQYIKEIEGIADGANVDFHKLLLFHFDDILANVVKQTKTDFEPTGCSTIYIDGIDDNILGHTEDAAAECLNTFYIVSAHIITETPQGIYKVKEEKFSSLCYPGHLGGYTMSYNHHGLIVTINTLVAEKLLTGKTPRHFIARALMAAGNYEEVIQIVKDSGVGAADACSINFAFINENNRTKFYNIEMGPGLKDESKFDIKDVKANETFIHCNNFLRLKITEDQHSYMIATKERYKTLQNFPVPKCKEDVLKMLGDTSHDEHWIFRCTDIGPKTICVGIFDFKKKTWSLYKNNPKSSEPIAVLQLDLKE